MTEATDTPPIDENKLIAERREKLAALRHSAKHARRNDSSPNHLSISCRGRSLARSSSRSTAFSDRPMIRAISFTENCST